MKLGHIPNLTNEQYHAMDAVGSGGLRIMINQTPAHYKAYLEHRSEPTAAQKLGTATHAAILEPSIFAVKYVEKPEGMSLATIEGKAWKAAQGGKEIIPHDDFYMIKKIQNHFKRSEKMRRLFSGGVAEQSYMWQDEKTGLICKCRPDYFDGQRIFDIKTTEDASPRAFQYAIKKYSYHLQAQFYARGMSKVYGREIKDFVHVLIEKKPPFAVAIYVLDDASLERADIDIDKGLEKIKRCQDINHWEDYGDEIQTINLPTEMWNEDF